MKKLFVILSVTLLAACGSNSTDTTPSDSASAAPHDTTNAITPPMPDTAKLMNDTNHVMGDTSSGKDSMSH